MTKKKGKHELKKKKTIIQGNTIYYVAIILVLVVVSAGIIALQSNDDSNFKKNSEDNSGKWLFALDTPLVKVGSLQAYRTGYIPTLVIIDVNGNIMHKESGVHSKQELLDLFNEAQQTSSSSNHVTAPDFTLETFGGKQFKLSEYKGIPVILDFMAVRCPPCHQQMPELFELKKELGNNVVILSIDVDAASGSETIEDVRNAFESYISEE